MAGSDLPSGGSGGASLAPTTPQPRSTKRKRGDSAGPASLPSRATRSSAAARKTAVGAVRMARRAAAGALWTARTGRGRGFGDVERMRAVILGMRLARSVRVLVPDDDPNSPYPRDMRSGSRSAERVNCNISYLSRDPPKRARTDPVEHQASVPGWENKPSKKEADDYKAKSLANLGTIVCPLKMDIPLTADPENTRKELVDKCSCSHPGSEDCVLVHVQKARSWIKEQLGEEAFKNCGLDVTGEQVEELWTTVDKKKLEDVYKSIPQNEHQTFMKTALKELSDKEKEDLAKYYYNVFLPRRLASFTRAGNKDEDVDTGDEKSSESDDNNEHRPRKKSKSSGSSSSSKRCRKWNIQKNLMSGQRKKN